ncbi:MAG: NHL repeat-containing protein, partial [Anaerolineae bacterium]|nr:NHL repeat-containing protein [Anaerolineae bacterium]
LSVGTEIGPAEDGTFREPWGVALSPDGQYVYVADTWNHRVQKFTSEGDFITAWGTFGDNGVDEYGFYGPRGIAVDNDGHVLVSDTGNKRIMIYDEDGEFLSQLGGFGLGLGQFDEPVGLTIDRESGLLYVADTWNQRIQVLEKQFDGTYIGVFEWTIAGWDGRGAENKPYITVGENGNIFITDPEISRVIAFAPTGEYLFSWFVTFEGQPSPGLPIGVVSDGDRGVWVSDSRNNFIYHYTLP